MCYHFTNHFISFFFACLLYTLYLQRTMIRICEFSQRKGMSSNTDLFSCEVSVNEKASDYWEIDVTLESNHLLSGDVKYRFFTFLQAALALYELCVPCSIDLHWDEEFASQHLIRVQSVASQEPIEPLFFCGMRLDWQKIACIQEHCIFIPKSIPIYAGPREGFRFLVLSQ